MKNFPDMANSTGLTAQPADQVSDLANQNGTAEMMIRNMGSTLQLRQEDLQVDGEQIPPPPEFQDVAENASGSTKKAKTQEEETFKYVMYQIVAEATMFRGDGNDITAERIAMRCDSLSSYEIKHLIDMCRYTEKMLANRLRGIMVNALCADQSGRMALGFLSRQLNLIENRRF